MKYSRKENIVDAIYNSDSMNNIFLEAMPELLSKSAFENEIKNYPRLPYNLNEKSSEERRKLTDSINQIFIPMNYMYAIYDTLFRGITSNYMSCNTVDTTKQIHLLYNAYKTGKNIEGNFSTQSFSGAILGVPGIGKTSAITRCLRLIPQVIIHTKVGERSIYFKQITYIKVECPSDCSVKTLAYNIVLAVDLAIGSQYYEEIVKYNRLSASALAIKVKIICMNHHIGIIIIDEIQNAVTTAMKNRQTNPLIKFLVELTNETYASICFAGTLLADELFNAHDHLKRRTRGLRLLQMKPDKIYYSFLSELWPYQMTLKKAELNENIANFIYDYSGGIPAYIVKIFIEAQLHAILTGIEKISVNIIKDIVNMQNIQVPISYAKGTSISSFEYEVIESNKYTKNMKGKKGRPVKARDQLDIIELYKETSDVSELMNKLELKNFLEVY